MSAPWSAREGIAPHDVLVYERADRGGVLELRWWDKQRGNWRRRSLGLTIEAAAKREAQGQSPARARKAAEQWARTQALTQALRLAGQLADDAAPEPVAAPPAALTILDGWARATHPETGKYLTRTPYVADVERAVQQAASVWDNGAWNAVDLGMWERFWRARIRAVRADGAAGLSAARHAVERVHAVARWLRDRRLIDLTAAVLPGDWREAIARDWAQLAGGAEVPEPARPRYTLEEARRLLAAAERVDPRLALLLALGAELRAGQVLRAERHDLTLWGIDTGGTGPRVDTFRVRGRGKKQGVTLELTPGQRAAVNEALGYADAGRGYLRVYEQTFRGGGATYPLFPGGALTRRTGWRAGVGSAEVPPLAPARPQGTMSHRTAVGLLRDAEAAADPKVPYVPGRSFHGLRRAFVDGATGLELSNEGLMQLGGWTDERTPKTIYRDRELVQGRGEARDARARLRGEGA